MIKKMVWMGYYLIVYCHFPIFYSGNAVIRPFKPAASHEKLLEGNILGHF